MIIVLENKPDAAAIVKTAENGRIKRSILPLLKQNTEITRIVLLDLSYKNSKIPTSDANGMIRKQQREQREQRHKYFCSFN